MPENFPSLRIIDGVTIIGPDFFVLDDDGMPLSHIATAFPCYSAVVTGRGIHATQVDKMIRHLAEITREKKQRELTQEEEDSVYDDAVALMVRAPYILIRSDPDHMNKIFQADLLLQQMYEAERIQFTGLHISEVRRQVRIRGESWRISLPPCSVEEIVEFIRSSRVQVETGMIYYQNMPSGGRFLSYQQFMRTRRLLRHGRKEAVARLKEIVHLLLLRNSKNAPELSFLIDKGKKLDSTPLDKVISALESTVQPEKIDEAEKYFDLFAESFSQAAGPRLTVDEVEDSRWRTPMFCRLSDINENMLEECFLGLSPEFHLNVRWLPGARIEEERLVFEKEMDPRIREFFLHFIKDEPGIVAINIGRVEFSQSKRDRGDESRDVYLIVIDLEDGCEDILLCRMTKWDVHHRLKKGVPLPQAVFETRQYCDYLFDRIHTVSSLGIPTPMFEKIELEEITSDFGLIPVIFIHRTYVPGMATDKIPKWRYDKAAFILSLCRLLGVAAAWSLVLGRANPRTGQLYFDDGDEVVQLDDAGIPKAIILTEITGAFIDFSTPLEMMLTPCLYRLAGHLENARSKGVSDAEIATAFDGFTVAMASEITRMQQCVKENFSGTFGLFKDRTREHGGVRFKWENILNRLKTTHVKKLRSAVYESHHLAPFANGNSEGNRVKH